MAIDDVWIEAKFRVNIRERIAQSSFSSPFCCQMKTVYVFFALLFGFCACEYSYVIARYSDSGCDSDSMDHTPYPTTATACGQTYTGETNFALVDATNTSVNIGWDCSSGCGDTCTWFNNTLLGQCITAGDENLRVFLHLGGTVDPWVYESGFCLTVKGFVANFASGTCVYDLNPIVSFTVYNIGDGDFLYSSNCFDTCESCSIYGESSWSKCIDITGLLSQYYAEFKLVSPAVSVVPAMYFILATIIPFLLFA